LYVLGILLKIGLQHGPNYRHCVHIVYKLTDKKRFLLVQLAEQLLTCLVSCCLIE